MSTAEHRALCDLEFARCCREWIRGCTCAPADNPAECVDCTNAFLAAVLDRAQKHGLEIGVNSIDMEAGR